MGRNPASEPNGIIANLIFAFTISMIFYVLIHIVIWILPYLFKFIENWQFPTMNDILPIMFAKLL